MPKARGKLFVGNVREHRTPTRMLDALNALCGALMVTDRGIATEECAWRLRGQGYRYLVVGRERARHFDAENSVRIRTAANRGVHLHKVVSDDGRAVRPYCFFEERAAKERAIVERFGKRIEQVRERIGRPGARSRGVARHYDIALETDPSEQHAVAVRFSRRPASGSMVTHSDDWDEATLWRTHMTLTGIGEVFRSLKSEHGPRPVHRRKPIRAEGHPFITVIAHQPVQVIGTRLREAGLHDG